MTPDEINKFLAVEVMGWVAWSEYDPPLPYQITYRDAAGNVMSPIAYRPHWNPYHSIADAMRVVEKIVSVKGMSLIMEVCADHEEEDKDAWKWEVVFGEVADGWYGADKSLPAAISLAAVEWAKAKGGVTR